MAEKQTSPNETLHKGTGRGIHPSQRADGDGERAPDDIGRPGFIDEGERRENRHQPGHLADVALKRQCPESGTTPQAIGSAQALQRLPDIRRELTLREMRQRRSRVRLEYGIKPVPGTHGPQKASRDLGIQDIQPLDLFDQESVATAILLVKGTRIVVGELPEQGPDPIGVVTMKVPVIPQLADALHR